MTIKELKEILSKYSENMEVLGCDEHGNYELTKENIYYWNNQEDVEKYEEEFYECITIGQGDYPLLFFLYNYLDV